MTLALTFIILHQMVIVTITTNHTSPFLFRSDLCNKLNFTDVLCLLVASTFEIFLGERLEHAFAPKLQSETALL